MDIIHRHMHVLVSVLMLVFYAAKRPVTAKNDAEILNMYKNVYNGDGTYYWESDGGTCSLNASGRLPPVAQHVDRLVALNALQFYGSSACGMCLVVNGSGSGLGLNPLQGSFIVYVKDKCPECHQGDVDFALTGDGRWDISFQAVQCPVLGNIEYTLEGSNDYYIKLQVRNERLPATTLQMFQNSYNIWIDLVRTPDGHWQFPKNSTQLDKPIQRPFMLRLYAPNGAMVTDIVNPPSMGFTGVIQGRGVQFPLDPNLPAVNPRTNQAGRSVQYPLNPRTNMVGRGEQYPLNPRTNPVWRGIQYPLDPTRPAVYPRFNMAG